MRIKENNQYLTNSRGSFVKANNLFRNLQPNQMISIKNRKLGKKSKYNYSLTAYKDNKTSELIIVVHSNNLAKSAIKIYSYRWQIETMFKSLKSSGFNMEDSHITNSQRLETLFSIMAIAFVISYEIGDNYEQKYPQKIKKHGYKQTSTPKIGLDLILNWTNNCKIKLIRALERIVRKVEKIGFDKRLVIKNV